MSPEWLTALATVGTFVVIATSALAALRQLQHMRGANQIAAMVALRETMESAQFQSWYHYVTSEFQEMTADPALRRRMFEVKNLQEITEFDAPRALANFYEQLGALVKLRIVDQLPILDLYSPIILDAWNALAPFVSTVRVKRNSKAHWENFEYLAALSEDFMEDNAGGTYPRGTRRLTLPPPWPEASLRNADHHGG